MDLLRSAEAAYQLQHQHRDGTWAAMEEVTPSHHGSADHDPERGWLRGRIFKCTRCAETVTIVPASPGEAPEPP